MKLPAHYTTAQVLEVLKTETPVFENNYYEAKRKFDTITEVKYKKTWFGYYKEIENGWFEQLYAAERVSKANSALKDHLDKVKALEKLPPDAKVCLSISEINHLFGENE